MLNKWRKDRESKLHGLFLLHRKGAQACKGQKTTKNRRKMLFRAGSMDIFVRSVIIKMSLKATKRLFKRKEN